ncbi:MAG TPA: HD domain-containing protein, partial [Coprothermobacter proteolyticus]|nr:HD domain-containing protein [Coprothermobacter proteolyticus]
MTYNSDFVISLVEPVSALAEVVDLSDPRLVRHQEQVAYIALAIAEELRLPSYEQCQIALAGELHDIGFLSLEDRLKFTEQTFEVNETYNHELIGYALLRKLDPLKEAADMIRFHHLPWNNGKGKTVNGIEVPLGSHII